MRIGMLLQCGRWPARMTGKSGLVYFWLLLLTGGAALGAFFVPRAMVVTIGLRTNTPCLVQVFYPFHGTYDHKHSVWFHYQPSLDFQKVRLTLPANVEAGSLRFDIGDRPGTYEVTSIIIDNRHLTPRQIAKDLADAYQITQYAVRDSVFTFVSSGIDPHFSIPFIGRGLTWPVSLARLYAVAALLACFGLATANRETLGCQGKAVFQRIVDNRYKLAIVLFSLLVMGKLHGFSTGMWDNYILDKKDSYTNYSVGVPRSIRSDEWAVSSPLLLLQCSSKAFFPHFNTDCGFDGMNMFIASPCNPVFDITLLGQVQNWGFFALGPERGLAWDWWIRIFGILLLAFELFMVLTDQDSILSATAAVVMLYSSTVQWWSNAVPLLFLGFLCQMVGFWYWLNAKRLADKALFSLMMLIGFFTMLFVFYVPLVIIFLYWGTIVAWYLVHKSGQLFFTKTNSLFLAGMLLCIGAMFTYVVVSNFDTLTQIKASTYPGHRSITGGDWGYFAYLFYDLICLYFPFQQSPLSMNVCERSTAVAPWGAILIAWVSGLRRKWTTDATFMAWILAFSLFLLGWATLQWPRWIGTVTLFFLLMPTRVTILFGSVLQMLCFTLFSYNRKNGIKIQNPLVWTLLLALIYVNSVFYYVDLHNFLFSDSMFKGFMLLNSSVALLSCMAYGLLSGKRAWLVAGFSLYVFIGGWFVHPLTSGADAIFEKKIVDVARHIRERDPQAKWIASDWAIAQFFRAVDIPMINGVLWYPQVAFWKTVDPNEIYKDIYNRYAHVEFSFSEQPTTFKLKNKGLFEVAINVHDLQKISGLGYIITHATLSGPLFERLYFSPVDNLSIYQLIAQPISTHK